MAKVDNDEDLRNNYAVENIYNKTGERVRVVECKTQAVAKIFVDSANAEFKRSRRDYKSVIVDL